MIIDNLPHDRQNCYVVEFKREYSSVLREWVHQYPAIVLTGARQVGKTTLLKSAFPAHTFVSLDLPSLAERAEREPQQFLREYKTPLIIDEVQYAPALFRYLKIAIDEARHEMGRFILTGSQKFNLMKEVSDSLAGRVAIGELEGLSLSELDGAEGHDWTHILARGQYPELWRMPTLNATDFYASYVATYLERDVRQILNVHNLRDFERFLRAVAARSAQLLNLSDLARDVGIKPHTARDWLSVLEASGQVSLIEPYFENVGKRMVKSPKVYLHDSGLLCFLLGVEAPFLSRTPLIGAIWETFVYAELRKTIAHKSRGASLWFYRDAQGREVDFLRIHNGLIQLIEAKWAEVPDARWNRNLADIAVTLSASKSQGIGGNHLICRTPNSHVVDGVHVTNPREMRFA